MYDWINCLKDKTDNMFAVKCFTLQSCHYRTLHTRSKQEASHIFLYYFLNCFVLGFLEDFFIFCFDVRSLFS